LVSEATRSFAASGYEAGEVFALANGSFSPFYRSFQRFEVIFSFRNTKSAILCPAKTEVADFVSFKGSIVQGINLQRNIVLCRKFSIIFLRKF
jgi:hypothetical protein